MAEWRVGASWRVCLEKPVIRIWGTGLHVHCRSRPNRVSKDWDDGNCSRAHTVQEWERQTRSKETNGPTRLFKGQSFIRKTKHSAWQFLSWCTPEKLCIWRQKILYHKQDTTQEDSRAVQGLLCLSKCANVLSRAWGITHQRQTGNGKFKNTKELRNLPSSRKESRR